MLWSNLIRFLKGTKSNSVRKSLLYRIQGLDNERTLVYIHIGKCGGMSTIEAVQQSKNFNKNFDNLIVCHVSKPPVLSKAKYMFVVRNPINRTLSAFNWRYKHVILDGGQKNRYWGEEKILRKYDSLNDIAENLIVNGVVQSKIVHEFSTLHHIKEDAEYYLRPLIDKIRPEQIICTATTEKLDHDLKDAFGCDNIPHIHKNSAKTDSTEDALSELARKNLKLVLNAEYFVINELTRLKYTSNFPLEELLR